MSSAASRSELQAHLLEARDRRQLALEDALCIARAEDHPTVIALGTNVPGPRKLRPGLARLLHRAGTELKLRFHLRTSDLLGPFQLAFLEFPPEDAKCLAIALEESEPAFRLLDVDVYSSDGRPMDRACMTMDPRRCLVCEQPARECIRLGRHTQEELDACVDHLLEVRPQGALDPRHLADALTMGAQEELDLTPKPGLVDRRDAGSHADLTYESMRRSVALLPRYFDELMASIAQPQAFEAGIQCGVAAEQRMRDAIGANAHKGYLFLSGLVLLAAKACPEYSTLSETISGLAQRFFDRPNAHPQRRPEEGIRAEAMHGLPAIFVHGWPAFRETLELGWTREEASFYLMAILMQHLEDTTALHRCGAAGMERLREDGLALQWLLERRQSPRAWLAERNDAYRRMNLTMGGVADCMALTFALERCTRP